MTYIHSSLFFLHILFGTCALILFWVPLASKKGQLNHRRFGKAYKNVMYMVAGTGALMAIMVLAMPLVIKHEYANAENAAVMAERLRHFWLFLLYLALLSFLSTRHGDAVLKAKDDRSQLRTTAYVLPIIALGLGGIGLIALGSMRDATLHLIFGILGTLLSVGMLRYIFRKEVAKRTYYIEHIGSMIGSGIGAYTAFLSFGGRHLFEGIGNYQLVFWIAPGVLGSILSFYLSAKYAKVYKVEKGNTGTSEVKVL
jgi:hypothetical protein